MAKDKNKPKPNAKDRTEMGDLSEKMQDFIVELRGQIVNDDSARSNWKRKMIAATNQRLGIKRYTDDPYPGAPDIPLPETDKLIKKSIPNLVLSAWSPKKLCTVRLQEGVRPDPILIQRAQRAEMAMNQRLRSKDMNWFRKLMMLADNMKHHGHCIARLFEEFKTRMVHESIDIEDFNNEDIAVLKDMPNEEKKLFAADFFRLDPETDSEIIDDVVKQFNAGEQVIEFDKDIISSLPNIEVCLPTKIIVPPHTTEIGESVRVAYEVFMTRHAIEQNIAEGVFRDIDLDTLDTSGISKDDKDDIVETQKDRNEGIESSLNKDLFKVHIVNTWMKLEGEKESVRWTFVFLADVMPPKEATLYSKPFSFEWEGWDYEKCDNEIKDSRYYSSRGLPEQIRAIQEIMERSINNMLIRDEMNNTPMWEVSSTSEIMDGHVTFSPGEKIPVSQIGTEINKLNPSVSVDLSSERIIQYLKASAEEYQASTDQLFRNATNAGGGKTKGEIQMGIQQSAGIPSVEVINFNEFLSRIYQKMFEIFKDRLGESIFVDGIEVTKEDFDIPADVRSNGNLEVSDQVMATQKSFARLQTIISMMQVGIVNQEDAYNAARDWLEKDGVKDPDLYITNPMEMAQNQGVQLQQQLQQMQQQGAQLQEANLKATKELARTKKADIKGKIQNIAEAEEELKKLRRGGETNVNG